MQKTSLHSYTIKKNILVFSSCGGKIKAFRQSFEAIDYAFARKNYQLLKIIFQNTQKMMVQKDIFLQSLQDVGALFKFHQFKSLASSISAFNNYVTKRNP